ncbi:glycosyltransferase [Megamonas funiformis]|mgnify:CR=1 FL=1|uniref:glycosyltransferase n=1 Tax=Megamonas funiformis TaxID=437897 RepID=UPI00351FD0C2
MDRKNIFVSLGIIVYNEEKNIGNLLEQILKQRLDIVYIKEIVVVSSACVDNTEIIVKDYMKKDDRIKLISQKEREGKSSAINLWLNQVDKNIDVCIMESGDTIPKEDTVEKLACMFKNKDIGMAGVRPIPNNNSNTFVGYAVKTLWSLHHYMAKENPKLGEMVAFRNVIKSIPKESSVDEASIEVEIVKRGYLLKYVPEAIIINHGPETVADFLKQRRRIAAGHLWLKDKYKYNVATSSPIKILKIILKNYPISNFRELVFIIGTIILEGYSRILGFYDYKINKNNHFKWEIIKSTKEVIK